MTGETADQESKFLVSTDWLAERIGAPGLAIIDASWHLPTAQRDGHAEYIARHIPGAVYFDIDAMRKLGIGEGMKIVVYDSLGLFSAPRVWWTFRAFGVRDVVVLDGGLPKWLAEGRPVAEGEPMPQPRHFTARLDHAVIASLDDVRAASAQATSAKSGAPAAPQIVDARSAARFSGDELEPRPGLRSGHIPGSRNLPWSQLIADGRLLPPENLATVFAGAGVDLSKPTIASCGSGVTAAILALAAATTGRPGVAVYDGSWAEWGPRSDLPLAKGPA